MFLFYFKSFLTISEVQAGLGWGEKISVYWDAAVLLALQGVSTKKSAFTILLL